MNGLSQAVAAYIAEHGEIDKDTYDALAEIYTEGAAEAATESDLNMTKK